ncbi:helix-turn-helix domain-containing protein [Paenibacillus alvei]|uniref:Helix-turn-helix domain-containing protein n=1 Tax=Paenibacillus alvei TaxID=44250 RepID=A0ABT4GUJ8_PAEAL|nr:helix-turn-helix transcriptional regulator [Paenibacillus alvei]MCY9760370.1 helix-turn-helix domain-containing protein [Paenibacillus alvei]MCY9767662.1 helix-turn-helix domain-containing protein [Paenibacillus alvei]
MNNNLGDAIREHRTRLGLSLRGFADIAGVSHSYLGKIERGESIPPQPTLNTIVESLHLKEEEAEKIKSIYMMEIGYDLSLTEVAITRVMESKDNYYAVQQTGRVDRATPNRKTFKEELLGLILNNNDNDLSYKQAELIAGELSDFYKVRIRSITRTGGDE